MKKFPLLIGLCLSLIATARGVILFDTGDPTANTTAPGGALANSGWQFQGNWGSFSGTPIAPQFFISAAHIGQAAGSFSFGGTTFPVIGSFSLPDSDFLIWKVSGSFTNVAPLATRKDEVSQHLVVIGRGTQRGTERTLNNTLRGWNWGTNDTVRRWGENDVDEIVPYHGHDLLYALFDQHVQPNDHPNEAHLSSGDSGGGLFINDAGVWKLAGVNFAVDDLFAGPSANSKFDAAIFDARDYYTPLDNDPTMFMQISDPNPVPTGFYASRVSSELAWICSVIADPQIARQGNNVTLTYWRLNVPSTAVSYQVQQTGDLIGGWGPATTQDQVLATVGDLQQVQSTINPGGADRLFVRLQVTRP